VLFASDSPFGPEQGAGYVRMCIEAMEQVDIPKADKEKINFRNAKAFFGLK
jgi:aminocarboxymuconate-semialdehyde decarboxylase